MPKVSQRVAILAVVLTAAVMFPSWAARGVEADSNDTAGSGGTAAAADLSAPARATAAFVAAMRAGNLQAVRAATTGATDADYVVLRSWADYIRSAEHLRAAMESKFGADAGAAVPGGGLARFGDETALDVKTEGDSATVSTPNGREHLFLKRSDGKWRIEVARLPNKDQLSTGAADMRAISKVMDRFASEIADGRYSSADDANKALGHAMEPVLEPEKNAVALAQQPRVVRTAVDFPPKLPVVGYDPKKVDAHRQVYEWSGIPMAVELILKLTGREPPDFYQLQEEWKNKRDGNFINFDSRTISGLTFHHRFDEPRGNDFPIGDLFKTINSELDHGRYVCIALYNGSSWGIYVIVGRTASGDFHAVTKGVSGRTLTVTNVKARVREMKGTDILTCTMDEAKPGE